LLHAIGFPIENQNRVTDISSDVFQEEIGFLDSACLAGVLVGVGEMIDTPEYR